MFIGRNRYHTSVKIAYSLNLLPDHLQKRIPRSSLYRFKNSDFSNIFGLEYAYVFQDYKTVIEELLRHQKLLTLCKALIDIKNTIIHLKESVISQFNKIKTIVSCIEKHKDILSIEKAVSYFKISKATFYSWKFQLEHICHDSFFNKCIRRWPNQLAKSTVHKMKALCEDEKFRGRPLASIAYFAKRNNIVSVSLNTWYKYAKLLNISRKPPKSKKKQRKGIRAVKPNQFWHADVTIFRTTDNVKSYIYFIVDNFSRAILSWDVSLKLCAQTRLQTITDAYSRFIDSSSLQNVQLIVDGGSENNNELVNEFMSDETISVRKLIAGQDIHFSNSMVEAVNKIVKYQTLYLQDIPNFQALKRHLTEWVYTYNEVRPHISLEGLTPAEVLSGSDPNNRDDLKKAGLVSENRSFQRTKSIECTVCV